jgi:ABC-type dipeptide/oligopeptide/nickel transport system ATPase subunit
MTSTIIELHEVNKTYSTAAGDFVALKDVNLKVNEGEFLGIIGKSGAGKSTLLNMINGVDQLTSGEVLVVERTEGEFFGEMELLHGGKSIANVRAGNQPVEVVIVPRAGFMRVIDESPITAEAIGKIVQKRLEDHRSADHRAASR